MRDPCWVDVTRGWQGMTRELLLAGFIMCVGLSVAGAGTHLYQWLARQEAMLRMDPSPEQIVFDTLLEVASGEYEVKESGDV